MCQERNEGGESKVGCFSSSHLSAKTNRESSPDTALPAWGGMAPTTGSLGYCTIPLGFLNLAYVLVNSSFIKLRVT